MKRFAVALFFVFAAVPAFSQSLRTFVATYGSDAGLCPQTAPCRTLAYALTQTNSAGEMVVLDNGSFGSSLNINKAVNIVTAPGIFATLTNPTPGTETVSVNAGVNDVVRMSGVRILGAGPTSGQWGVSIGLCKRTEISNMNILNVAGGVRIVQNVKVVMRDLFIGNVTTGIHSVGTNAGPVGNGLRVFVEGTTIAGSAQGVLLDAGYFRMDNTNKIIFATTDQFIIDSDVPSCSSISNQNGTFNNFTGTSHPYLVSLDPANACGLPTGQCVQDKRRGDVNQGDNCNATP